MAARNLTYLIFPENKSYCHPYRVERRVAIFLRCAPAPTDGIRSRQRVFLVNPSAIIPPAQDRSPQQAARD